MKFARVGGFAVAVLAIATMAFAQAKTDFSGTWNLDTSAMTPPAGGGGGGGRGGGRGGLGMTFTAKQTADSLVITRTMGENTVTTTYKLDGTESKNQMTGRGGQTMESVSTTKWDGPKLVVTTKTAMGDQTFEQTQTWSLDGGVLTVETTGGRGGPQKFVYKKG